MEWNLTSKVSAAVLVLGLLFYIAGIALIGASPVDIGLMSTTVVFLLFGVFGFLLGREQVKA